MAAAAAALAARMARNSLRVIPGFMPAMVACGAAADQAGAPRGAHSSLLLHIHDLCVQRFFQLEGLASGRAQARVADEPGELRVGARERAQQAFVNGALQVGIALILEDKPLRREFEQAGVFAHPRGSTVWRAFQHREVAHQLAGSGERRAPLQVLELRDDFHGAALPGRSSSAGCSRTLSFSVLSFSASTRVIPRWTSSAAGSRLATSARKSSRATNQPSTALRAITDAEQTPRSIRAISPNMSPLRARRRSACHRQAA